MQGVQVPGGFLDADSCQGGGGVGIDRGTWVQAEAAEKLLLAGGQVSVRQVERGGDAVFLRRQGENARPGLSAQIGQGPGRVPGVHPCQQRDRQWQIPGEPDQLCHRLHRDCYGARC